MVQLDVDQARALKLGCFKLTEIFCLFILCQTQWVLLGQVAGAGSSIDQRVLLQNDKI